METCIIHIGDTIQPSSRNQCLLLKVSPALCPSLSLIHWYLKCQGWPTSSCPHSIVLLLVHCPQPIQIIIGIAPVRGEKAKRSKFSGFLLLKSNSWHYTLNVCSFDIKQTDESKTCWMLEIKQKSYSSCKIKTISQEREKRDILGHISSAENMRKIIMH